MSKPWPWFAVFLLLAFLLLALVPLAAALFAIPSLDFSEIARRASLETGVAWTSNLVDVVRLAMVEPGLWLLVLGSAVPTLAAAMTLAISRDRRGAAEWLSRYDLMRLVRSTSLRSLATITLICIGVVAALLLTFEIRQLAWPGAYGRPGSGVALALAPALIIGALFDQGAVLEEGGWRGFATPLLQAGHVNPLLAALVVGAAWGMWHVPRDIVSGVADRLGLLPYLALYLPSFVLGAIAVSVPAAACSNCMGGSIFPAILLHGLSNDAIGFSGVATIEAALTPAHQFSKALPMLAIACIVALASKGTLWFDDSE